MTPAELEAIRKRAEIDSPWNVLIDRNALLVYVDELRTELAALKIQQHVSDDTWAAKVVALKEAAGKVTCALCRSFDGRSLRAQLDFPGYYHVPCPDCADLRALLKEA